MHHPVCLLSKRYPSETFALLIKNEDHIINLCSSGSITIFCYGISLMSKQATASRGPKCIGKWNLPKFAECKKLNHLILESVEIE